ncbi:MAG TPA: molybdenum cofactor biosynthesis protein MoaE [Methanothermococcus okinawensis]|uniref:Molybdenum cofactor biosynthesis protein MoaE n=1 Tax=Methanothermococcus okinawensis TaxID=155863 RepID=A0A833E4E9_9EURY|nr:molybdenum cofactor biosynthesis protein MoaE [Methanococcaceae archaeon]HIP84657.1 molybdenum cofactor biosynthesis protein MoaE [Methanothermococcus okinawensis]HIP91717.1 molybdenum cofactor biosynthesis protein MoaE [Methanothermococcus okinawensis]
MRIYNNYEEFRDNIEKLVERYKGEIGCYVSITGYVRDYHLVEGKKIPCKGMVVRDISREIEEIVEDALKRFKVIEVVVYHNRGYLKVGDIISSVYVFARHRKEAFLACEYIIEEIKKYH